MKCEKCGKEHDGSFGSGRFCSNFCAKSRIKTDETKEKISLSLKKIPKKNCTKCGKLLDRRNITGLCSICVQLNKKLSNETKNKLSQIQKQKVQNGTHQGWKTRNIKSYAEKFFENVLSNEKINFEREKSVGKFFLDFVIDGWLDLEIDGKQHKYKERKESDLKRDYFLRTNGYFVYRIAWNEINSNEGKQIMKEKIDLFLEFYTKFVIFGND